MGAFMKKVYMGGEKVDNECREIGLECLTALANGELEEWLDEPQSALAYCILADQFSRNIHRGTANGFATDEHAKKACKAIIGKGKLGDYKLLEMQFILMPLMHSENDWGYDVEVMIAMVQKYMIDAMKGTEFEGIGNKIGSAIIKSCKDHIIPLQKFGRYPTRNEFQGRKSTPEEVEFLKTADSYGQKK